MVTSGGDAIRSTLPPRESKAIQIVPPEISKMPAPIDLDIEASVKEEETPLEMTNRSVRLFRYCTSGCSSGPNQSSPATRQRRNSESILWVCALETIIQPRITHKALSQIAPHMVPLPLIPMKSESPDKSALHRPDPDAARLRLEVPDPLLTPPLSAHQKGDGVDEMLGQIKVLGDLWSGQQEAQEKFAKQFMSILDKDNLKQSTTGHVCIGPTTSDNKPALVEMSSQLRALREDNARLSQLAQSHKTALDEAKYKSTEAFKETVRLKAENKVLKESFGDVALQNSQLGTMVASLKKRKDELKAVLAVTKGQAASRAQVAANLHPFVMILLDGHARMFDPDLLAVGRIGEQELAKRLIQAAQQATAVHLPDEDIPFLTGMLFVDVAELVKGCVQFRDFCDGYNSSSSLMSLMDTEGASTQIREAGINLN
ncbi:hypothetical protein IAU59_007558 [Kwoniella sp. CBS 9459]